jgi:hypothetical protein
MLVRQLILIELTDEGVEHTVLAEYWMEGDHLRADYKLPNVRMMMEGEGISVLEGDFYPHDGRKFFDGLPLAMSYLSFYTTRDIER